ncbi:hypothetical protein Hanom_Chr10g00908131 [Helianthus anomalus]
MTKIPLLKKQNNLTLPHPIFSTTTNWPPPPKPFPILGGGSNYRIDPFKEI